jgi:Xaa-Pro aminopeptidase
MTEDMSERIRQPISTRELERRWSEARKAMASRGIDCLVMQGSNSYLGMYVRWFTDVWVENGYPWTVVFPAEGEMTAISHGSPSSPGGPPAFAARGIKTRIGLPYFLSANYTNTMDAEAAAEDLRARKAKRVGIVGKAFFSAASYECLVANLSGVEILDFTDEIDRIQVVKSDEEIALIKQTAKLQDDAWSHILGFVRPGMKEYEVRAELQRFCVMRGSEEQWLMLGSAPAGQAANQKPSFFQNRTLREGDQLTILIEVNGPGGYYTEIARTVCLGSVPEELARAWEVAVEAQKLTAQRLVPGARPGDLLKANNEFMVSRGYSAEHRIYAHGQGYNLVERPLIREDEPMLLTAGMNIAVHPMAINEKAFANCCDNYIITERGAERIHTTPLEVFSV